MDIAPVSTGILQVRHGWLASLGCRHRGTSGTSEERSIVRTRGELCSAS